ncbi:hypothetical protein J1N35_038579, partial [Gossypium stocksii]
MLVTSFKSSTRLECIMQDYLKTLPPLARVRLTVIDTWLAYAPVKNNPEDVTSVPKWNPYHSATSREMVIYRGNNLILKKDVFHSNYVSHLIVNHFYPFAKRVSKWRILCNRFSTAKRWKCGPVLLGSLNGGSLLLRSKGKLVEVALFLK